MYGRIISIGGTPTAVADFERDAVSKGIQAAKSLPGLNTLHVMIDRAKGKMAIVEIFDDAQSATTAIKAMAGIRQIAEKGGLTMSMNDYADVIT